MNSSEQASDLSHIGRYRIESLLGRGGMAVVYLAFDPYMERRVAIKVLLKNRSHDDSLRSRFKRESRMVASLNHPAIVPVYDFGEDDGQPYLVMRYMENGSLRERLRQAPLELTEVASILNHIAPALDTTHAHNIIHRDLKPSNILFDKNDKAYLADFGLAKFAEGTFTTLTHNDGMVGTPAYMSPEQIRGQIHLDGRTDIYALGVILFEILAGRLPFAADGRLPIALMHLSDPVPNLHKFNPNLPKPIGKIIRRAMAKRRDQRFATASDLTIPFIKAAEVDSLPPVDFPDAPPIILQPESESGTSSVNGFAPPSDDPGDEPLPDWLQAWLDGCGTKQDIGRSRTRGTLEDRLRVGHVQTEGGLPLLLAIVSDGSSSQQHGHLAAELTITELFNQIALSPTAVPEEIPKMLQRALQQTNRTLFAVSRKHREPLIMQSMVALVAIYENRLFMAHVGNGRIFLIRNRRLFQLNRPSPVAHYPANGSSIGPGSLTSHSSAIGLQPDLHIDLGLYLNSRENEITARRNQGLLLQSNDRLLLCSDGLMAHNGKRRQRRRLRRVISENVPYEAANILVQDALARNVPDNVTAVVLQAPGTVPYVPPYRTRPFQLAAATISAIILIFALLTIPGRSQPEGVFFPPGTATQIAQIINGLTTTAVAPPEAAAATAVPPLIAPAEVPDPGFAVIFAAGEGAMFRESEDTDWQTARAGHSVAIGENAAIRSGNGRMGVVLSDGAELYLAPNAELALEAVSQGNEAFKRTQLTLAYGRLLVHYKNADPHDFELTTPAASRVQLPVSNNIVGIIYENEAAILEVDCFTGDCRLGNSRGSQLLLPTGRYGSVAGLNMTTRSAARFTIYCDLAPTLVACPTPTPVPTQTLPPIIQTVIAATETASALTATPLPSLTPSSTPTTLPSVTPLPTGTSPPGVSSTPPPSSQPTTTPSPVNTATATPTTSPTATLFPTPTASHTPLPTSTPSPQPTATSTLRFTASPIPTLTPTIDPDS